MADMAASSGTTPIHFRFVTCDVIMTASNNLFPAFFPSTLLCAISSLSNRALFILFINSHHNSVILFICPDLPSTYINIIYNVIPKGRVIANMFAVFFLCRFSSENYVRNYYNREVWQMTDLDQYNVRYNYENSSRHDNVTKDFGPEIVRHNMSLHC